MGTRFSPSVSHSIPQCSGGYKLSVGLLSCKGLLESFTIINVIYEFQIESRLDVFVLDNVDNNDTAVRYILNELKLHDTYEEEHY